MTCKYIMLSIMLLSAYDGLGDMDADGRMLVKCTAEIFTCGKPAKNKLLQTLCLSTPIKITNYEEGPINLFSTK